LRGARAVDVLVIGDRVWRLASQRLSISAFHGGGCTMASLVAGYLASAPRSRGKVADDAIVSAAKLAKRKLAAAIRRATSVGRGLRVLPL
jgi:hydroxymethylpyrimidine/phosphomethylpyrimidine kinase